MSDVETLGILDEIQALVSDKLQVVSYKWLSRNFLVSSNTAKRLLQEFVTKHDNGLEVVYALSGWLKDKPLDYHVRLVSGPKLAEAKQQFSSCCSVQVYSVQACIPKDPATLWNAEFVQAEELFSQPSAVENCLRDNRFCGVSSSFVRRNADGSKKDGQQSHGGVKDVKKETNIPAYTKQVAKPPADKGTFTSLPSDKKAGQDSKPASGTGGSLANLWDRASTKSKGSKAISGPAETSNTVSAEAQISVHEAIEVNSDDEDINFRRATNGEVGRKRKVVFDFSDEENEFEEAVSLASPEFPKAQSCQDSKGSSNTSVLERSKLDFDEPMEDQLKVEKEKPIDKKATNGEAHKSFQEDISALRGGIKAAASSADKKPDSVLDSNVKVAKAAPSSPKSRKVLKTRIDERRREVTEVVWEGTETKTKASIVDVKKPSDEVVQESVNKPAAAKKPPAGAPTGQANAAGKGGNKKGAGAKDPKQGNILSFFKRV